GPDPVPVRHARPAPVLVHVGRPGQRRDRRGGAGRHAPIGRQLSGERLFRRGQAALRHRDQRLGRAVRPLRGGGARGALDRPSDADRAPGRPGQGLGEGHPDHAGRARALPAHARARLTAGVKNGRRPTWGGGRRVSGSGASVRSGPPPHRAAAVVSQGRQCGTGWPRTSRPTSARSWTKSGCSRVLIWSRGAGRSNWRSPTTCAGALDSTTTRSPTYTLSSMSWVISTIVIL